MTTVVYASERFQPRYLSEEEISNPYLVIHELFAYGHLSEIQEELWLLLRAAATGCFNEVLTKVEQSDLFGFYELVEKVFEALYLIEMQQKVAA